MISLDFMVCDLCRFSEFVSSCDLLDFEISRFSDFPTSSDLLECVISRFFYVVFCPEFEDLESSPLSDFQFSGLSMCGCLGFLILWVSPMSGVRHFQALWIPR